MQLVDCAMVIGDGHFTGLNPVGRMDNLVELQYDKLREIVSICNAHNLPGLCVADLFNTSNIGYLVYTSVSEILNDLLNPWYIVWGNHDLLYHSMEQWKKTALGALLTSHPMIRHISTFEQDYGISWSWHDWGRPIAHAPGSELLLSHQAVVTQAQIAASPWIGEDKEFAILWDEEVLRPYRIIICGHWHQRYYRTRLHRCLLNPGPILRRDVTEYMLSYQPSISKINLNNGLAAHYQLQSAPPAAQVMSRKHITDRPMSHNEHMTAFINKVFSHKQDQMSKVDFLSLLLTALDSGELELELELLLRDILSKVKENTHDAG